MTQTATITMKEGYGLYEDNRGVNAPDVAHKTTRYERGGLWYPNSLEETARSGVELPYSDWCAKLAAAGCNLLRVTMAGWNRDEQQSCDLEPPPYGTYNIWHNVLNPNTLATYRTDQVTYPPNAAFWAASNLKEFLDQCDAYGIRLLINPFDHREFLGGWSRHAWNVNNYYINGVRCEVADRGFLTNFYEMFDNATAIQAAKDRLAFMVNVFGTHKCVVAWELITEGSWLLAPSEWGTVWGSAHTNNNIRGKVKPWVVTIASYLRSIDPYNRPIGTGLLRSPTGGAAWSADPDNYWNVINEPWNVYPIDFLNTNFYFGDDWDAAATHFKRCKQYTNKLTWVTQFWPFEMTGVLALEEPPYLPSKKLNWIPVCGQRWGLNAVRWQGIEEAAENFWISGGYADANYYTPPGVLKPFMDNVSWNTWKTNNYVFDSYISTSGTNKLVSYGDGEHVTMLIDYTSVGTKTIDVSNLSNGTYTFTYYDWTDGSVAGTLQPVAAGGSMSISMSVTPLQDNMVVAHLLKN